MRRLSIVSGVVLTTILVAALTGGCAESHQDVKPLTSKERDELVKIALSTDEASALLAWESSYRIEMRWLVITGFQPVDHRPMTEVLKEEEIVDGKLPPHIANPVIIYPAVLIRFGEPENKQLRIVIDRELRQVVLVDKLIVGRESIPPTDKPVVVMEVETTIAGRYYYLAVAEDGTVIYIEEQGLRHPTPGNEAVRTKRTGQLSQDDLTSLARLFQEPPLSNVAEYHADTEMIDTDAMCQISFSYLGATKTIGANYNPLVHDFMPFPEIPSLIKEIFLKLKYIVDYKMGQEVRELIACD